MTTDELAEPRDPFAKHTVTPDEMQRRQEAERAERPFLAYRDAAGALVLRSLDPETTPVRIGRRPANDVCIAWDAAVSGAHAELDCVAGEWTVSDDGLSSYGSTWLNGARVTSRARLHDADRLRVGDTMMVFSSPDDDDYVRTVPPGGTGPQREKLSPKELQILIALCRPLHHDRHARPATNREIENEVSFSESAIETNLGSLYKRFGVDGVRGQKRQRLAQLALDHGLVLPRDY